MAEYSDATTVAADVVRNADVDVRADAARGTDSNQLMPQEAGASALARIAMERELREGIPRGELELRYQPKVDSWSGRVVGVEALVRWNHPARGLLAPDAFIALAEESRLIVDLDAWVLETACRQASAWAQSPVGRLSIAVNVSGRDLEEGGLLDRVRRVLGETRLDPQLLELEITESVALQHDGEVMRLLREIRALGVRIAIDDFGTGYSMLSRLQDFPVDTLKVDRSFISRITTSEIDFPIVAATVAMARSLGLEVVAEGVETDEQRSYLVRQGPSLLQGYLISRPVAAELIPPLCASPPLPPIEHPHWAALDSAIAVACSEPGVEDLVRGLLVELQRLTGLDSVYLTRIDWDGDVQEILYSHNAGSIATSERHILRLPHPFSRRALTDGFQYADHLPVELLETQPASALGRQTSVSVPVVLGDGRIFGTLCGASARHIPLAQQRLEVVRVFASLIGAQIAAPTAAGLISRHIQESPLPQGVTNGASGAEQRDEAGEQRDQAGDQRDQAGEQRDQAGDQRDRAGEQRDHAGEQRDRVAEQRDQAGGERDQAADQRDEAAHQRDQAADQRDEAAHQRDQAADQRDHAGGERDQAADQRDQAGGQRDQAAEQRDQAAYQRDRAAERSEAQAGAGITTDAFDRSARARREAASDRMGASRDRRAGASARSQAELDRDIALADRGAGATERTKAEFDRDIALADRRAGAGRRTGAELDRDTALADRGAGANARTQAVLDRDTALADRGAGASARTLAELDRNTALADRGASAREREHAAIDVLTGVYRRGAGFVALEREVARARRTGGPLILAFVDVDKLKDINDSHGHAAGDRMLREVADTFRAKLRPYDLIIRYGGDEFVCAISGLSTTEAADRLALVNMALAEAPQHGSVTIGIAELQPEDSVDDVVARADAALYRERQQQRRIPA